MGRANQAMGRASSFGCLGLHTVARSREVVERSRWLRVADEGQCGNSKTAEVQMRYQRVVQIKPASADDFHQLVKWEDALAEQFATSAEVDGHDLGAGEFNIFFFTDDPSDTFRRIQGLPETR